jgi:trehalose synthase
MRDVVQCIPELKENSMREFLESASPLKIEEISPNFWGVSYLRDIFKGEELHVFCTGGGGDTVGAIFFSSLVWFELNELFKKMGYITEETDASSSLRNSCLGEIILKISVSGQTSSALRQLIYHSPIINILNSIHKMINQWIRPIPFYTPSLISAHLFQGKSQKLKPLLRTSVEISKVEPGTFELSPTVLSLFELELDFKNQLPFVYQRVEQEELLSERFAPISASPMEHSKAGIKDSGIVSVNTTGVKLRDYIDIVGEEPIRIIVKLTEGLRSDHIYLEQVNSSADAGGGVATILFRITALLRDVLDINSEWRVITPNRDIAGQFFTVTTKLHYGVQGNEVEISDEEIRLWRKVNRDNKALINPRANVVIIHDPQSLPLGRIIKQESKRRGIGKPFLIWRFHPEGSNPNPRVKEILSKEAGLHFDLVVFTLPEYARAFDIKYKGKSLPTLQIAPSLDPLDLKNRPLDKKDIKGILEKYGIEKRKDTILIGQVSRIDPHKGWDLVLDSFDRITDLLPGKDIRLVLIHPEVGSISDNSTEGPTYSMIKGKIRGLRAKGKIVYNVSLPGGKDKRHENAVHLNAMQSSLDIGLQLSSREGFGLTLTELMFRGIPCIVYNTSGLRYQAQGEAAVIINNLDEAVKAISRLIKDVEFRKYLGIKAKEKVIQNFLITRELRDYLLLMHVAKDRTLLKWISEIMQRDNKPAVTTDELFYQLILKNNNFNGANFSNSSPLFKPTCSSLVREIAIALATEENKSDLIFRETFETLYMNRRVFIKLFTTLLVNKFNLKRNNEKLSILQRIVFRTDDEPSSYTQKFLGIAKKYSLKAKFNIIGAHIAPEVISKRVRKAIINNTPQAARMLFDAFATDKYLRYFGSERVKAIAEIVKSGYPIGNHTFFHPIFSRSKYSSLQFLIEIIATQQIMNLALAWADVKPYFLLTFASPGGRWYLPNRFKEQVENIYNPHHPLSIYNLIGIKELEQLYPVINPAELAKLNLQKGLLVDDWWDIDIRDSIKGERALLPQEIYYKILKMINKKEKIIILFHSRKNVDWIKKLLRLLLISTSTPPCTSPVGWAKMVRVVPGGASPKRGSSPIEDKIREIRELIDEGLNSARKEEIMEEPGII